MSRKTVGAKIDTAQIHDLDCLALRWSEQYGREITRSDVVRALLVDGLERSDVTTDERARVARGEKPNIAKAPPRALNVLRLATSEEGTTSPRGFHGDPRSRGQGAHEQLTDIAA